MMPSADPSLLEIIKTVTPVVTFFLGYGLGEWRRISESRKKVRNIKTILFKEIGDNYTELNKVLPAQRSTPAPYDAKSIAIATDGVLPHLSRAVYDKYLDRLDTLTPDELHKVYDAYLFLMQVARTVQWFNSNRQNPQTASAVENALWTAHSKSEIALRAFKGGDDFITRQASTRSEVLRQVPK
jgi:hypothetical protein